MYPQTYYLFKVLAFPKAKEPQEGYVVDLWCGE